MADSRQPALNARRATTVVLLSTLGVMCLVSLCRSIPALITSDALYLWSLYTDLVVDRQSILGWHLQTAPSFFPDGVLFFVVRLWSQGPIRTYQAYAVAVALVTTVLTFALGRSAGHSRPALVAALSSITFTSLAIPTASIQQFFLPSHHSGAWLGALLMWSAIAVALRRGAPSRSLLALTVLLAAALVLSDLISIPQVVCPALLGLVIAAWRCRLPLAVVGPPVIALATGAFVGERALAALQRVVSPPLSMLGTIGAQSSGQVFADTIQALVRTSPSLVIVPVAFFAMGMLGVVRTARIGSEPSRVFTTVALAGSTVLSVVTPIATGIWTHEHAFRYMYPAFIGSVLIGMIAALERQGRVDLSAVGLFMAVALVPAMRASEPVLLSGITWATPEDVECFDTLAAREGLTYGFSDYWNAKYMTAFSRRARIVQVTDRLRSYPHIMNDAWYCDPSREPRCRPSFIVGNRLSSDEIRRRFGPPGLTATCGTLNILVFNRKTDALATFRPPEF